MKTAQYKSNGGTVTVIIKSGYAQPAAYSLLLWDPAGKQVLQEQNDDLNSADGATYTLPLPNDVNDGRLIDVGITFTITPPINDYSGEVIVMQDNSQIGSDSVSGSTADQTKTIKLLVKIEKGG
jgi:hypothetical protein